MIKITVLMSVYNGENWLCESIESVLAQTFSDFEFIIVNDGSKDNSLQIINSIAAKDRRIRVIDKLNTGLADSLNQGIAQASGEWIARIDADDVCEPNRLAVQYAIASYSKKLVLLGSGLIKIDNRGRYIKTFHYPDRHTQLLGRLLTLKGFFPHSSAFFHANTVRSIGGYRTLLKRAQDYDLWLRLSEVGEIACAGQPLVRIRQHTEQVSHDGGGRQQKIDAHVALTSYFLRQRGFPDPLSGTDSIFVEFRHFIERGVLKNKVIEYQNFINSVKLLKHNINLPNLVNLVQLLIWSPSFVFRYIFHAVFSEELPLQLSELWINRNAK